MRMYWKQVRWYYLVLLTKYVMILALWKHI